ESKRAVVKTYEMGLTQIIDRSGLSRAAGWTQAELVVTEATDLPLQQWKQLLEAGFPFVKRVLLTGPQFADQRAAVEQAIWSWDWTSSECSTTRDRQGGWSPAAGCIVATDPASHRRWSGSSPSMGPGTAPRGSSASTS